jgi:hypothetical protein
MDTSSQQSIILNHSLWWAVSPTPSVLGDAPEETTQEYEIVTPHA